MTTLLNFVGSFLVMNTICLVFLMVLVGTTLKASRRLLEAGKELEREPSSRAIPEHYTEPFWIAPDAFQSAREDGALALIDTDDGIVLASWHAPCSPNCKGYWLAISRGRLPGLGLDLEYGSDEVRRVAILGKEESL